MRDSMRQDSHFISPPDKTTCSLTSDSKHVSAMPGAVNSSRSTSPPGDGHLATPDPFGDPLEVVAVTEAVAGLGWTPIAQLTAHLSLMGAASVGNYIKF